MTEYSHYVYTHTRNDTGEVFYVGKGRGARCRKTSSRNSYWRNTVAKCGGFKAQIIAGGLSEIEAFKFEKLMIAQIKAQTSFNLTNLNDGGKGGSNPSEETRAKIKLINLGRKHTPEFCERQRQIMLGNVMSAETKEKLSASLKGRTKSKEHVEKVSKALLGKKHTKEAKDKMSKAKKGKSPPNKGVPWSDETRAKIAKIWEERRKKGTNKRVLSESHKAAMKAAWIVRRQKKEVV